MVGAGLHGHITHYSNVNCTGMGHRNSGLSQCRGDCRIQVTAKAGSNPRSFNGALGMHDQERLG